jgi:hypothetical protein
MRNAGELSNRFMEDLGTKINQPFEFFLFTFFSIFIDKIKDGIK